CRKMLHIPLKVHLGLLAVGRRRQCRQTKNARTHAFCECSNRAAFSGSITSFKDDNNAKALMLHPILQLAKFSLEAAQLLFIFFAFQSSFVVFAMHSFGPNIRLVRSKSSRQTSLCP